MLKLSRFEKLQKEQNAKTFKPLLDELTQCHEAAFVEKLNEIQEWDRSRDDLFVWTPVLNRIDEILSRIVTKYSYASTDFKKKSVKLIEMSREDEKLSVDLMEFTTRLLCNTENRYIYSSMDVMNNFLNCPNFRIKLHAVKVLAIMGERYIISRDRIDSENILGNPDLKKKVLKLALALPSSTMDDNGDHFSLVDLFFDKKYPLKWTKLKYAYYTASGNTSKKASSLAGSQQTKEGNTQSSSMKKLLLSKEDLQSHSLQQLYDKGMETLPAENWFDYSIKVAIAKAFSDNSFENIELRNMILRTKFNAIAATNTIYHPPQVSSKLFEVDPYAFNSLTDFISLSETKLPKEIRMDSLFALECVSLRHVWCSDIVRNLGGNMSHGLMFQILRYISKILREGSPEVDEEYNVRLFYLISNLSDVKTLHDSLLSAGLISSLLDIISVRKSPYRRTMASATHLLEAVINDGESSSEFINNNGFTTLINLITEEVDFALANPDYGTPPKYSVVYYSVSFRQLAYIRSLLKLVLKLLKTDSGDRIRNLIDSPILGSLKKILENRPVFGYTLITYVLDVLQKVINSEPTIYPILLEAGLIPYIIDHFRELLGPYSELLSILPDVISALCLNNEGLQKVKEKNMVRFLFDVVTNSDYAKVLHWKAECIDLGASMDELSRHYPELKPLILDCFCDIVKELPHYINFNQKFLYTYCDNSDFFYRNKDENVILMEDNEKELSFWDVQDSTPIVDCFADILYGMTLENSKLEKLPEKISVKELFSIIVMENPPFDYTSSQAFLNFTDVLQLFDEQYKDFAFPELIKMLAENLDGLNDYLMSSNEESFILKAKPGRNNLDVESALSKLSQLTALIYIITDVYVNLTSLSPKRVLQIMDYFDKNGFKLIENLRLLFQKCALEEMYITSNMPDKVIGLTLPPPTAHTPPIQIHAEKPSKREQKDNYTSAKFKNTFQTRSLLSRLQSCTSMLFRCLLRLSKVKDLDLEDYDRALEVHIFDEATKQIISMLRAVELENHISYFLVVFNFNTYVFTFPKTTITGAGILQTVPAYLFYQGGGYKYYAEAVKFLFSKMSSFEDLSAIEEVDYVKNSEDVLILSCLLNVLSFFNKSMQLDSMENIQSMETFYPYLDNDYNVTKALILLVKTLALGLIIDLSKMDLLFCSQSRNVPYAVFKHILTMLKNVYYDKNEEGEEIYELSWDLIPISRRKIQLLKTCGITDEVARGFLEETEDELPVTKPDIFSETEWDKYQTLTKKNTWQLHPALMEAQYGQMTSYDELSPMRNDYFQTGLPQKVFEVLPFYPKLVNAFAKTLLQLFSNYNVPSGDYAGQVLDKIIKTDLDDNATLSSFIHLFGIFLNEGRVYENSHSLMGSFLNYLQASLNPKYVNCPWFSKALYVYEIILAKSEVPVMEEVPSTMCVRYRSPPDPPIYRITPDVKQKIFEILIRVGDITNFYSALATCRILLFYARDSEFAIEVSSSGILSKLLKVIGAYQKSDKINYLESSFLLLTRRCFETADIVASLIRFELNKSFTTRVMGTYKERERNLGGIIDEKAHVVMRNPKLFVNILCEETYFRSFNEEGKLLEYDLYRKHSLENKKDETPERVKNISPAQNRTGIVHLLLSQLMAASKKDWVSEPASLEEVTTTSKNGKVEPARNPVCAYMIFLMKILVELISSYKQSKFEFLTFDRRNSYAEFPKPRTTALNFFFYQLLDKTTDYEQNKHEAKRREVISMLARSVIVGFVSTVQDEHLKKKDLKSIDPDMTFIRKFTIETVTRALKNSTANPKMLEANVSKLDTWFKVISSMVFLEAPYLRLILDSNKVEADQYQICKLMIDMNVPSAITECIALLDLNYPFCKKLFNNAVDPLNAINSVRKTYAEMFKVESNDEEVDVDDDSDKEDPSDMFRNSALGMYDVADIEEDDEGDDDSLIGDDEEIAFVDGEDEGFEVVFSDDNDEEIHSTAENRDENDSLEYESGSETASNGHDSIQTSEEENDEVISGDEGYYYDGDDEDVEIMDIDAGEYDSDLELDLSDYNLEESDWESGLSELSASDEEDSVVTDNNGFGRNNGSRRRWTANVDGIEIIEGESDEESGTGLFQGIEHVFQGESQPLYRVQDGRGHSRHHHRSFRNHDSAPLGLPSLTLLHGTGHHQSNLINPLGPSGLEEIENSISEQLSSPTNQRSRPEHTHFGGVLVSGDFFDDRSPDGIVLKSTVMRWKDIYDMFYDMRIYSSYIFPEVISRLYYPSLKLFQEERKKEQEKVEKRRQQKIVEAPSSVSVEQSPGISQNSNDSAQSETNRDQHEPVYVNIEGSEVDIGGTDIDAEFLNALPDDMRAEVFAQHVRERRAEALHNDIHSREIDADFLDAIPENLREEILDYETAESRFSNIISSMNQDGEEDEDMESESEVENDEEMVSGDDNQVDESEKKKSARIYFSPLVDRSGTAALMKSTFIAQPYVQREIYHQLFYRLCSSKQNRGDIINLLLLILTEGVADQTALERVYNLISTRAHGQSKFVSHTPIVRQLPVDCTPLIVANQAIEILQHLIDSDNRLKYFFITEHENLMVSKAPIKNKKDIFNKNSRWPVKHLFALLDKKIITDETVLMDLLTRILQVCTKPIRAIAKNSGEGNDSKKKFPIPYFERSDLEKIVSIIKSDSCNTRVFQQTLNIMHNLASLKDSVKIFTEELISSATTTMQSLIPDLEKLTTEGSEATVGSEINSELVQKFTVPSSNQAKLLKVLTAVDYLYAHKKTLSDAEVNQLMGVYSSMHLGKIWEPLSKCLSEFEIRNGLNTSATVLLPLIESLMVVFKHAKTTQAKVLASKFSEGKSDLSAIPVENLFFFFTEAHKKLLNQMIRSNPKLMSGPFSLLVKNPKILDFDNKRYYFTARLLTDTHERPKLSITVRREHVFLDSYRALFFKSNDDIKKSKLEITFKGESGVDAGGLTREWYQVLSRQMFNPDYALFLPVASDKTTFRPNRTSGINPEHLSFFKFIGMIIGKAIRDQCYLDCHFSREVYKNILGRPVSLKDMESLDLDYYKSLVWILENDITDIIEETFSVEADDYGEHKTIDLVENGSQIPVTEDNKQDYVKRIVQYKLQTSVTEQMENFLQGFYALIPVELISIFDEQELELLISGLPDIDVDDWKNNTTYVNYTSSCKQINYFWRAVRSFDLEERAKLLQFVTGTSKVPLNGFKELTGVSGVCKFSIHRDYGHTDRLPTSHTCFNQLNLPSYNSYETLRGSLLLAINEGHEGFGIA